MADIAIRVDHLSKLYRIGRAQGRHDTLRDAISDFRLRISDLTKRNPQSAIRNPTSLCSGDNCSQSKDPLPHHRADQRPGRAEICGASMRTLQQLVVRGATRYDGDVA